MKKTTMSFLIVSALFSSTALADSFTMTPAPMPQGDMMTNQMYQSEQNQAQTLEQPQQNTRDYGFSANARVEAEKEKVEPKSAAEQGYNDVQDLERSRMEAQNYFYKNTARQKGYVVNVPTEDVGVAKDPKMKMWLFNWKGQLTDRGISAEKVEFEASRLNKADFERWASRQLRYANE